MKETKYASSKQTHERIKLAFAELLAEKKAISNITVAELSNRAGVTRGTFYAHYDNIFSVAEELENEFISRLEFTDEDLSDENNFQEFLHQAFEFLASNEDLYRQLLSSDAPMVFVNRLNLKISTAIRKALSEKDIDHPMLDLDISFFVDGATYMLLKYFRNEINMSLEEIEWYLRQRAKEMFLDKIL